MPVLSLDYRTFQDSQLTFDLAKHDPWFLKYLELWNWKLQWKFLFKSWLMILLTSNSLIFLLDWETLIPLPKLSWALFPEKNWGGPGPPGPLGDYIPEYYMGKKNPVGPRQKPIYKRHGMLCKSIESSISYICTLSRVILEWVQNCSCSHQI